MLVCQDNEVHSGMHLWACRALFTIMLLRDVGEFGLIERISSILPPTTPHLVKGIGDDAAILKFQDVTILLTSDMLVEGIHFDMRFYTPQDLGYKAIAASLSDIAAMAGEPVGALVSLGIPLTVDVDFVEKLYEGMCNALQPYNISVIGGDTVKTPDKIVIDVTVLGKSKGDYVALRSGAKPGDAIAVTGYLGNSAAGLFLLKRTQSQKSSSASITSSQAECLTRSHLKPVPRVSEAQEIARVACPTAMIDISDGLAGDIRRIAEASRVGARIWEQCIPISDEARSLAREVGASALQWAISGGEDYELLFTFSSPYPPDVISQLRDCGIDATIIGEVTDTRKITLVTTQGRELDLQTSGYDHFA